MDRLPVEIVHQICRLLCPHCQCPTAFPNADTNDTVVSKASLARLARTCKSMCAIVQPFVFHYYATGNLPDIFVIPDSRYWFHGGPCRTNNDNLWGFLRSIMQRPDLAKYVQALQLVTPGNTESILFWKEQPGADETAHAIMQNAKVEFGPAGFEMFRKYFTAGDLESSSKPLNPTLCQITSPMAHHVLAQLVILLCPSLSTLLLTSCFAPFYGQLLRLSKRTLPALKTIGLLSHSQGEHYSTTGPLLSLAPNLETIYAHDLTCPHPPVGSWGTTWDWEGAIPNVRKVVLQHISIEDVRSLVRSCPQLCELRCVFTVSPWFVEPIRCRDIVTALAPVHKTLQWLTFRIVIQLGIHYDTAIWSLGHFETLEELSIQQDAIYGPADPGKGLQGGLACLLPRSIIRLHISHVVLPFDSDLGNLARDAQEKLPNLRSVRLSSYCLDERLDFWANQPARAALQERFQEAGIALNWGEDDQGRMCEMPGVPVVVR